ncbi:MAG: type IV pilus modification PilV family protein [Methylomicrobium sp.]
MKSIFHQKGVGLIEVMVAAIVFAVGIAALVKLQGNFFKYSSAANGRSIAMSIAEEKMEDLRGFQVTDASDNDIFDFTSIASNTGGRCDTVDDNACSLALPSGNVAQGNLTFTRSWISTPYYYNGTTLTTTANGNVVQKLVTVNVGWTDTDGTAQTASLSSVINSTSTAAATGAVGNNVGGSGESPKVYYTPQAAPDVIAQPRIATTSSSTSSSTSSTSSTSTTSSTSSSGGNCAIYTETDKPDPTIDNNSGGVADNNLISFSTTTYKDCGSTPIALKKEEFFTLNCSCELSGTAGTGFDQGHNPVTKAQTGVKTGQTNGQNALCDTCCQDHHENTTGDYVCDYSSSENRKKCYTPFRNDFANNDHNHYASSSAASPVTSGTYLESCRLKRVAGYWTVVSDWNLVGLNAFVRSDLTNSTNVTSYQNYVADTVNAYVSNGTTASAWTAPSATTPVNGTQMMARGIFIDYMTPSEKSGLNFSLTGLVPQEVPFYEYHVSSLADWKTTKSDGTSPNTSTATPCPLTGSNASVNKTCVDSPTVAQVANANQNQTIDKGVFRMDTSNAPTSDIKIVAQMKESNSGVTGTVAINALDTPVKSASVTVPFSGSSSGGTTFRSITLASTPSLTCPAQWGNGNNVPTYSTQYVSTWSGINLSCSPSSGNTSTCTNYTSNQSSVAVTASNTGNLQCVYSGSGNIFTCPTSLPTLTITSLSGTKTCTIAMSKSGNSASCALVCQ